MTRPRTSLTVIARDEEHNLPDCLGSVAGLFDQVVVADTGSRDRTRAVAAAHPLALSGLHLAAIRRSLAPDLRRVVIGVKFLAYLGRDHAVD